MTSQSKKRKRLSGPAAIKAAGDVAVLVRMTPAQREAIERARLKDGRTLSNFVAHYAALAAQQIGAVE